MKKENTIPIKPARVQLNARVPATLKKVVRMVAIDTGESVEQVVFDAFAWFYNHGDSELENRHRKYVEAFKRINHGREFPFDCTPDLEMLAAIGIHASSMPEVHNGMVDPARDSDGPVAQLVERRDGIAEAQGATPCRSTSSQDSKFAQERKQVGVGADLNNGSCSRPRAQRRDERERFT